MKNTVKVAPNSKESEMMVLGCMLSSYDSLNVSADNLDESDFYYKEHKIIFKALKQLYKRDKPADIHLLAEELKQENKLEEIGGISYLTNLAQYAGTSAYIEEYTSLVKDKSILRQMIISSEDIIKKALNEPGDVYQLLDESQAKFFTISQAVNSGYGIIIKDLLNGVKSLSKIPYLKQLQEKQELYQSQGPEAVNKTGIATNFTDLDKLINGFNPSNLMILAARPAMGKTALALNLAENICFKSNKKVGIFSLEMTAEQLLHRMICSQSQIPSEKIQTGSLNGHEYQRVVAAVNNMQNHCFLIDDQSGLKITDLRARARRMKESHNIDVLIIDYLQLISGSGTFRSSENRQNEISEISRMLKNLAKELNIPVLCLSQLSRKVEERHGHRPMMSDLRESGCLTGDSQILADKIYTMKELAQRDVQTPIEIFAYDNGQIKKHKMVKVFYSGKKEVFLITTKNNKKIKASANHPFLKNKAWTRVDQLKIGDRVATYEKEIIWDEIISIENMGIEEVFDATVENVHNFIANGFIVHNSIEQDSDLVFFLLRREYYDPYDKPGQAELIVAKNRHGSIGSVNLTFRKELAQFANYIGIEEEIDEYSKT